MRIDFSGVLIEDLFMFVDRAIHLIHTLEREKILKLAFDILYGLNFLMIVNLIDLLVLNKF